MSDDRGMRPRASACLVVLSLALVACGGGQNGESQDPAALLQEALRLHAQGNLEAAEAAYLDVIRLDPQNEFAYYNLGVIAQGRGDDEAAEESYRTTLRIDADFVPALFNLAILQTEAGVLKEAVSLYDHIIEVEPGNAAAHLNLGFVLIERGKVERGQAELAEAVRLDPSLEGRISPETPVDEPTGET
jgi:Tfp pilus assembly protein PilF